MSKNKILLLVFIFFIGMIIGCSVINKEVRSINDPLNRLSASAEGGLSTIFTPASTFYAVMKAMNTEYVEKITPEFEGKMSVNLVKGMLREMGDQNTRYVEPEEAKMLLDAEKGLFEGIGIRCKIKPVTVNGVKEEKLYVGSVLPGSNAEKAGLKNGDIITSVNGMYILPYNPLARAEKALNEYRMKPDTSKQKELQKYLEEENKRIDEGVMILEAEKMLERGTEGTLDITINDSEKNIKITSGRYSLRQIETRDIGGYQYIRVNYISQNFGEVLKDIISPKAQGIVLDLRDVFGGNSGGALEALSIFVPNNTVFRIRGQKTRICKTEDCKDPYTGKLAVLVSGGTSRWSELITIALLEFYPGTVVCGNETDGELFEITYFSLANGGGYTVTSGKYLSRKGTELAPVKPAIPFTDDLKVIPDLQFLSGVFSGGKK